MAKMVIVKHCKWCPFIVEIARNHWFCPRIAEEWVGEPEGISEFCTLNEAPDVVVFKGEGFEPGSDRSFFETVYSVLGRNEVPAFIKEIES